MTDESPESQGQERYIHDYESAASKEIFARRSADVHGAFFLPYLKPDMSLLDCGCRSGSITLGFAEIVSPGRVIGMDVEESEVEIARSNAETLGLSNVTFETASIYELPYDDNSFDAVFSHAVFEHIHEPVKVLQEMRRVLKPGGVIGIGASDWAGTLVAPPSETIFDAFDIYFKFREFSGGNPFIGRTLRALLRELGFINTKAFASYDSFANEGTVETVSNMMVDEFTGPAISELAINMGWADQAKLDEIVSATKEWIGHPDAVFYHNWCEAIGWKE